MLIFFLASAYCSYKIGRIVGGFAAGSPWKPFAGLTACVVALFMLGVAR